MVSRKLIFSGSDMIENPPGAENKTCSNREEAEIPSEQTNWLGPIVKPKLIVYMG